jgi:hypothetical protein
MRYLRYLTFFFAAVMIASATDSAERLKAVKAIFVAPLEGENRLVVEMIHAKMISSLAKLPRISVVENEENADAILIGSGLVQTGRSDYGRVHYQIQMGVRLISKEGEVVLWADNITSSRFARSASSSFADNVAKSLGQLFANKQGK